MLILQVDAMSPVHVAPTRDRSVLGVLVDHAKSIPYHLEAGAWDDTTLPFVEEKLAQTPWRCSGPADNVVIPRNAVPQLITQRWGDGE